MLNMFRSMILKHATFITYRISYKWNVFPAQQISWKGLCMLCNESILKVHFLQNPRPMQNMEELLEITTIRKINIITNSEGKNLLTT